MRAFFMICLVGAISMGGKVIADNHTLHEGKVEKEGKVLPYRWIEVGKGDSPALVLFLHGMGERGKDNRRHIRHCVPPLLDWLKKEKQHCIVMAPQCPGDATWAHFDGNYKDAQSLTKKQKPSYPMALLLEEMDALIKKYKVDQRRIYITGLSMGGYGTFDALARRPHFFAAAMPICGGADVKTAADIKHVPMWVFHGDADRVVPPQMSRAMVKALKAAGGQPRYTEYLRVGHNSWSATYADPEVWRWLFKQKK